MKKSTGKDLDALIESMIKAIVFDFDGVIVDSNALKYGAFFDLFPSTSEVTSAIAGILSRNRRGSRFEILRQILGPLGKGSSEIEVLLPSYAAEYNERVQRGLLDIGVRADVSETLTILSGRYHLYINSGTYAPALLESVAKLEISHVFQKVYGRPRSKEDNLKDIMVAEKALGREIVVVGDGEEDYESAVALNCHFIGVSNTFNNWREKQFPLISSLARLPELMTSLDA
jgi:phosphoglycolate phosphatase-like HAD superfamily hydrolase